MPKRFAGVLSLLLVMVLVGCGDDDGTAASLPLELDPAGCEDVLFDVGTTTVVEIEYDGVMRSYRVHVPDTIVPRGPNPMVVNWHGLTSNALEQEVYAGNRAATERGYVVAYPDGLGASLNGGVCCSALGDPPHMADDVGFGRAVVADVARRVCIDRTRIYSTGMSNGGYMSDHNGCHAADLYAAIAPVSALGIRREECDPARPIPVLGLNGTIDPLVPYAISQQTMQQWAERNDCVGEPEREAIGDSFCDTWADCADGVEVSACTITGMEHCWPGNPLVLPGFCRTGGLDDIDANERMYDFFERHRLP